MAGSDPIFGLYAKKIEYAVVLLIAPFGMASAAVFLNRTLGVDPTISILGFMTPIVFDQVVKLLPRGLLSFHTVTVVPLKPSVPPSAASSHNSYPGRRLGLHDRVVVERLLYNIFVL